jgi:pyridoxamine 5'-phosphate oxidase
VSSSFPRQLDCFALELARTALESGDTSKRPEYWGGFQFTPYYIEFWSGDRYRLNKRQVFTKKQGAWKSKFLQP